MKYQGFLRYGYPAAHYQYSAYDLSIFMSTVLLDVGSIILSSLVSLFPATRKQNFIGIRHFQTAEGCPGCTDLMGE